MENSIKCDVCGRFVPISDLASGGARRVLATPDSHFTQEEFDTTCRDHTPKDHPHD